LQRDGGRGALDRRAWGAGTGAGGQSDTHHAPQQRPEIDVPRDRDPRRAGDELPATLPEGAIGIHEAQDAAGGARDARVDQCRGSKPGCGNSDG
jgi:hypothetical protein